MDDLISDSLEKTNGDKWAALDLLGFRVTGFDIREVTEPGSCD